MLSDTAYILHKRVYKDSSELIKLLTPIFGIMDVIAKGSRSPKSKFKGQLQSFLPTTVFVTGKSNLKTLVEVSQQGTLKSCNYKNHVSMLYCNELLLLLRLETESCEKIYHAYQTTIEQLQRNQNVSLPLRRFEWFLSKQLGYELNLPDGVGEDDFIEFDPDFGLQLSNQSTSCRAQSLQRFINQQQLTAYDLKGINKLMKRVIDHMVHGKTINSRGLL